MFCVIFLWNNEWKNWSGKIQQQYTQHTTNNIYLNGSCIYICKHHEIMLSKLVWTVQLCV